jgi:hypothetical protein
LIEDRLPTILESVLILLGKLYEESGALPEGADLSGCSTGDLLAAYLAAAIKSQVFDAPILEASTMVTPRTLALGEQTKIDVRAS